MCFFVSWTCCNPGSFESRETKWPNSFCAVDLRLPLVSIIRTIDVLNLWWVECKVSSVDQQGVATLALDLANWAQCTNMNQNCWDMLGNVTWCHVVRCSLNLDLHEKNISKTLPTGKWFVIVWPCSEGVGRSKSVVSRRHGSPSSLVDGWCEV